jgi:hypothetical protein
MSTYPLDELLTVWKQERITTEQAIGYLLQHMVMLYERQRVLEQRMAAQSTTTSPHSTSTDSRP